MQRYHTLKLTMPKSTPVRSFAQQLYTEVAAVWLKANIPMKSEKACIETVVRLLKSWTKFSADAHKCKTTSSRYINYKKMLNQIIDLAIGDENEVESVMKSSRLTTWKRDFQFYLNQKAGITSDIMEGRDKKLVTWVKNVTARNNM